MTFLAKISRNRAVQHAVFWILYLGPCIRSLISAYGAQGLIPSACIVLITLPVCYFNLYYLIPRFLLRERIGSYAFLVITLTLFYAFLWTLVFMLNAKFVFHSTKEFSFFTAFLGNIFDVASTMGMVTAIKLSKDWFRQQQRNKELAFQNLSSEIRLLKSQIHPHFLFNTLNSLYAFTLKKSDRAPETVLKLASIMEYMIYDSNESKVSLQKELKYLYNYMDLERLRQTEKNEVVFNISGRVNGQKIAPLLLLPFIENAFKHGMNKMANQANINVDINVGESELVFLAINNKPGNHVDISPSGKHGFGIKNVISRLDLLYADKYELDIVDENEVYKVNLKLNLA